MSDAEDGFTVVRCGACADVPSGFDDGAIKLPGVDEVLVGGLRAVVRDSRHGVLVTSGCLCGGVCAGRTPGMVLLVQRCDAERSPLGPLVPIGPVRTTEDVRAVVRWLSADRPDRCALPQRLRGSLGPAPTR